MGGYGGTADAHGSGPCEGNFMKVQILLSAPSELLTLQKIKWVVFLWLRILVLRVLKEFWKKSLMDKGPVSWYDI